MIKGYLILEEIKDDPGIYEMDLGEVNLDLEDIAALERLACKRKMATDMRDEITDDYFRMIAQMVFSYGLDMIRQKQCEEDMKEYEGF